jgi:hypothetical protein
VNAVDGGVARLVETTVRECEGDDYVTSDGGVIEGVAKRTPPKPSAAALQQPQAEPAVRVFDVTQRHLDAKKVPSKVQLNVGAMGIQVVR